MNIIKLSALALAALLTPLAAPAQDGGGSGASPAAPGASPAAPAKPAATAVEAKKKARGKNAVKKGVEPGKSAERRMKRGERLREKGEAFGGGKGQRLQEAAEKMEARSDEDKKRGKTPEKPAGKKAGGA